MNYLSSKQTSELWGISPRRIVLLASQGRIEGARQIDGRWFIPENAAKPSNPRARKTVPASESRRYIYPYILACVNSEEQIRQFTPEEAELYRLCLVYETGDFQQARSIAEALLTSDNPYIRLGALYHLPSCCMYLFDYDALKEYTALFRTAIRNVDMHRDELFTLSCAFDSELVSGSEIINSVDAFQIHLFPDELLALVSVQELFANLVRFNLSGNELDTAVYEILCRSAEVQGYYFCAMLMHLYLAIYYAPLQDRQKELFHLKAAVEIGLTHNTLFTLSIYMGYNIEASSAILSEYPAEIGAQIEQLAALFFKARTAYAEYLGKDTSLAQLSREDNMLISCCMKDYSIEKMAEHFGLSRSGINKRLSALYRKMGVKSKNELSKVYLNILLDWGNR